eukprot:409005-Pleurochrysis_carterae.AAC.1
MAGEKRQETINSEQTEVEKKARNSGLNKLGTERPERGRGKVKEYNKEFTTQSTTHARPPQAACDDTLSSMRLRSRCEQLQVHKLQLFDKHQQHRRQLVIRVCCPLRDLLVAAAAAPFA